MDKLKGFNFIRATAVYRVVINATPFHAGALKFAFVPFSGTPVTAPNLNPTWRIRARASTSTLPGPIIDARDSTAIMEIPYVSTTDYATIETNDGIDWGTWYLKVFSPLRTGASANTTVDITVYLHFKDVELAAPLHPQMAASSKSFKGARFVSKVGDLAKKEIAGSEAEVMASGGVLSRGLMQAGNLASTISEIPILSAVAAPVSWVLRGASTVASWFGFSKPDIDSVMQYVNRNVNPYMSNCTGMDASPTLALYHDNAIMSKPGFGADDLDEMNFNYLKKIPMLYTNFSWSDELPGAVLYSAQVRPIDLSEELAMTGTLTGTFKYLAPFAYFSHLFQVYRGSIDLHFKFVKTDFHSGKISIHFVPSEAASTPTVAEQQYLLREIVDIRDKSEIVLRIPYLQYQKYIGVDDSLGKIYVTVVNELRSPETTAQSLDVLVSASAGDDFEYAIPGSGNVDNFLPIIPQMGPAEVSVNQEVVSEVIGNYPVLPDTNDPSCMAIGEKFVSVKQLLMKYTRVSFATTPTFGSGLAWAYWPFTTAIMRYDNVSTLFTPLATYDALSYLAHGYAFMRGSIRVLTQPSNTGSRCATYNVSDLSIAGGDVFDTTVSTTTLSGATYTSAGQANKSASVTSQFYDQGIACVSARVPYYCENHSTAICPVSSNVIPSDVWDPYSTFVFSDSAATSGTTTVNLRRSVGEDFQLGYFLGFPPMANFQ